MHQPHDTHTHTRHERGGNAQADGESDAGGEVVGPLGKGLAEYGQETREQARHEAERKHVVGLDLAVDHPRHIHPHPSRRHRELGPCARHISCRVCVVLREARSTGYLVGVGVEKVGGDGKEDGGE